MLMYRNRWVLGFAAILVVALCSLAGIASAATAPTVTVRIEGESGTLLPATKVTLNAPEPVSGCAATSVATAINLAVGGNWDHGQPEKFSGDFTKTILGETHEFAHESDTWTEWVNYKLGSGICFDLLSEGAEVLMVADHTPEPFYAPTVLPLVVGEVPTSVQSGATFAVKVSEIRTPDHAEASPGSGEAVPAAGVTVSGGGASAVTGQDGVASLQLTATGVSTLRATKLGDAPSATFSVCVHDGNDGNCGTVAPDHGRTGLHVACGPRAVQGAVRARRPARRPDRRARLPRRTWAAAARRGSQFAQPGDLGRPRAAPRPTAGDAMGGTASASGLSPPAAGMERRSAWRPEGSSPICCPRRSRQAATCSTCTPAMLLATLLRLRAEHQGPCSMSARTVAATLAFALALPAASVASAGNGDRARTAATPVVQSMVVGRGGAILGRARTVAAPGGLVRVSGRTCAVAAATPLAALLSMRRAGGPGFSLRDYGRCDRSAADSGQLYVSSLGGEAGSAQNGWEYKVNGVSGSTGAADPSGPLGDGRRLRSGARVLWFWCQASAGGCQRTLEVSAPGAASAGAVVPVQVYSYDNEGRRQAAAGAIVTLGTDFASADASGRAAVIAPAVSGRYQVSASRSGLVPSFPRSIAVR